MKMKKKTIRIESIKDSDGWYELAYELLFNRFKERNPDLDEEELSDKFYTEIVTKLFEYGEFATLEIVFDENLNIVGGRVVPSGK